jgi:hypothetical protein
LFIGLSRRGVDGFLERLKSPTRPSRSTSGQTLVMQLDYQCRPEAHARAELRMLILYRRADATRRSSRKLRHQRHDHDGAMTPGQRPVSSRASRDLWCQRRPGASRHTQRPRRSVGIAPRLLLRQPDHQPMPPMQIELRTRTQLDRGHIARLVDPVVRILQ